jgi:hypothetical protein
MYSDDEEVLFSVGYDIKTNIRSINENITYSEIDNFIEGEKFLFNNIYIAAGEEFRPNLKMKEIMINHQYHPHPFFITCCMQGYNSVFSKEEEFKEHLIDIHKTSEDTVLTHNFNHWYIAQLFDNKFQHRTERGKNFIFKRNIP